MALIIFLNKESTRKQYARPHTRERCTENHHCSDL